MNTIILAAITVVATVSATPRPADDVRSVRISYADLNMASAQGRAALHRRVDRAVVTVCGDAETRDLPGMGNVAACRKTARAGVDAQLARIETGQQLAALELRVGVAGR